MPTPSEYLKRTSVIIVTGGSSGIGCSLIKAILKLAPSVTVCNLSRSKPADFFDEKGIHLPTDLTNPSDLAASAEKLQSVIAESAPGEVLLFNNSGFGEYGCLRDFNLLSG